MCRLCKTGFGRCKPRHHFISIARSTGFEVSWRAWSLVKPSSTHRCTRRINDERKLFLSRRSQAALLIYFAVALLPRSTHDFFGVTMKFTLEKQRYGCHGQEAEGIVLRLSDGAYAGRQMHQYLITVALFRIIQQERPKIDCLRL